MPRPNRVFVMADGPDHTDVVAQLRVELSRAAALW